MLIICILCCHLSFIRNPSHIYELRSYHLKPGTMVEWGNYWAKAIKLRDYQHSEAYMGLFSQIGELYNVKVVIITITHLVHDHL